MIFYTLTLTIIISWVGLILAQSGLYTLPRLLLSVFGIIVFIRNWLKSYLPKPSIQFHSSKYSFAFLILLATCAIFYARPHEYITGRWDPGTYMNTGFHIAQKGAIEIQDPLFKEMSEKEIELFVRLKPGAIRYPGFYLKDPSAGTLVPQFYHVYPIWIAIFLKLFGPYGSLFVNPFFALMSLWTLWRLAQKIFNPNVSLMACALLGFSITQIWNARFPTSEILAQYFILSGIYTLQQFEEEKKNIFGILSGSAFGLALLTRPTAILLLPCIIVYFACRNWVKFRKKDFCFWIPLGLAGLHLLLQNHIWTKYYVHSLPSFFNHKEKLFYSITAGTLGFIFILTAFFRRKIQHWTSKAWIRRCGSLMIVLFILGLAIYGYWIRPHLGKSQEFLNFVHLGWFLGICSLALAVFGATLWSYFGLKKTNFLLFIIILVETIFFLDKKRTYSSYPWALKRYTPVVIPGLALFVAYALNWLRNRLPFGKNFIIFSLCGLSILYPWIRGHHFITNTDQKGMTKFLTHINQKMDPEGIYLFERDWLAVPFQQLFQKKVLVLPESEKFPKIESILLRWLKQGKKIYYFGSKDYPYSLKLDFQKLPSQSESLQTSLIESSYGTYPNRIKKIKVAPVIYEIQRLQPKAFEDQKEILINIGLNTMGLLEGFDKPRRYSDSDKTYRWTQESSTIQFKNPIPSQDLILNLCIKNPKPRSLGPSNLYLRINQKRVGFLAIPPQTGLETYILKIDKSKLGHSPFQKINLEGATWNPKRLGITGDPRDLGIILDWVKILDKDGHILQWIDIGHKRNSSMKDFYSPEPNPEAHFWGRWTLGKARMVLPWPLYNSRGELILRVDGFRKPNPNPSKPNEISFYSSKGEFSGYLRAMSGTLGLVHQNKMPFPKPAWLRETLRPKNKNGNEDPITKLTISIDGKVLVKNLPLRPRMTKIRLPIPKGFLKKPKNRVVLTLKSNTWNPYQSGIKGFPHQLGILLDWVKIRETETSR